MGKYWYEFEIGFFVEADTATEAWEVARKVQEVAAKTDPDGEAPISLISQQPYSKVALWIGEKPDDS